VTADLASQGMSILATNLRLGRLELDVVARDGDTVIVVEVRHRGAGIVNKMTFKEDQV
jgi:putative endonuclease